MNSENMPFVTVTAYVFTAENETQLEFKSKEKRKMRVLYILNMLCLGEYIKECKEHKTAYCSICRLKTTVSSVVGPVYS